MDAYGDPLEESSVFSPPRNVLCEFPCLGTVLRIFVDMHIGELRSRMPEIGHWVKLRNITSRIQSGLWEGVMVSSSKVYNLSSDVETKYELESAEHLESGSLHMPQWCPKSLDCITGTMALPYQLYQSYM
eukprot:Gb_37932 [translate_table: standard]